MKMRPPSIPLITVDPYFSVWSSADSLYDKYTEHWTGKPNTINGYVIVDGNRYRFMGEGVEPVIPQINLDVSALVTDYIFKNDSIILNATFFTPLFTDDLYRLSRPASYLRVKYESVDNNFHDVKLEITVSEELCLDEKGQSSVNTALIVHNNLNLASMGNTKQCILNRSGDDLRIDWGYFYLASDIDSDISIVDDKGEKKILLKKTMSEKEPVTLIFAYDDVFSLNYFGNNIEALWKKSGKSIREVISEAYFECDIMLQKCIEYSNNIYKDAFEVGGEKYAELLMLSYRQVIAAHKLAIDSDGNNVFISKECFSNGCAATVDVTYPSSPFFILYNTELLKGMLRPIFKFARSEEWIFDFAPHDVGQYPLVTGQVYGKNHEAEGRYLEFQMPVEECGNMLIMMANIALKDGNTKFFDENEDLLSLWLNYLLKYGMDPDNQLCTDDFAGHLAHNCNLSLKAIMGIAGYSLVLRMKNDTEKADRLYEEAQNMARQWCKNASNEDGSFRLTFDRSNTFSMKYNMIWDKIWKTNLFPSYVYSSEFYSNKKHINPYGMPLDNRRQYTKSDWLVWTACLAPDKNEFEKFIEPLWDCYNLTPSRVPMTDWYDTVTSLVVGFRHRSVQGGLYIKLFDKYSLR